TFFVSALFGAAACTVERQTPLAEMTEDERSASLLAAVRDDGYVCAGVMHVQRVAEDGSVWRIACTDLMSYLAAVEPDGEITISLAPYVESPTRTVPMPPAVPPPE